ncbi:MAG: hypothetical protein ABIR47_13240 [Candidatus Kapaibacterium sp.]
MKSRSGRTGTDGKATPTGAQQAGDDREIERHGAQFPGLILEGGK